LTVCGEGFDGRVWARWMVCSACHRPEGLGALNWPMDSVLIGSYVQGGQMPRGHSLMDSERAELYRKLIQEYFAVDDANPGILKSWLLGGPSAQPPGVARARLSIFLRRPDDLLATARH